jgi:hypothetical protein
MRSWTIALILICVLLPGLALADIYYWIDDQGIQSYTTRLESIPEPYRSPCRPVLSREAVIAHAALSM